MGLSAFPTALTGGLLGVFYRQVTQQVILVLARRARPAAAYAEAGMFDKAAEWQRPQLV
jgi:hypothetical protein